MAFGDTPLRRGDTGSDVVELQIRLAGFRGTVPDGTYGPGTELQVVTFQRDFMKQSDPSGAVDVETFRAIDRFRALYPIDFDALACPCGVCGGFGQRRFRDQYRPGLPNSEATHRYEYPGIHRMLLWSVRALFHYAPQHAFIIVSGYRCAVRNQQQGRLSTNHHGKAIDMELPRTADEGGRDEMAHCDRIRGILVEHSSAQVGWFAPNRKAVEGPDIAPTWVHYDVRCYEPKYLQDEFFCTTPEQLDGVRPRLAFVADSPSVAAGVAIG